MYRHRASCGKAMAIARDETAVPHRGDHGQSAVSRQVCPEDQRPSRSRFYQGRFAPQSIGSSERRFTVDPPPNPPRAGMEEKSLTPGLPG